MRVATEKTALARLRAWAPRGAKYVLEELARRGAQSLLVGGGVRDAFLGRRAPDWDVATDALPEQVASWFPRVVRTGEKHGTIMVLMPDGPVEVTTFRGEGPYVDGRRPEHVVFLGDLQADLARRDLTINAMAADLRRGAIVDPFGGGADLRAGVIRCVGEPLQRFSEDGLRPLRAVRFASILDFRIEPRTSAALGEASSTFERVAWERKRDEMERMLGRGVAFARPLRHLERSGLLARIAPEIGRTSARTGRVLEQLPLGEPWLRLAAWGAVEEASPDALAAMMRRWRCASRDARAVERCLTAYALLPARAPAPAELRRWASRAGEDCAQGAALLARLLRGPSYATFPRRVQRLLRTQPTLSIASLAVNGRDLEALGLRGPAVGEALRRLLERVLDDPRRNERAHLLALAHTLSTGENPQ